MSLKFKCPPTCKCVEPPPPPPPCDPCTNVDVTAWTLGAYAQGYLHGFRKVQVGSGFYGWEDLGGGLPPVPEIFGETIRLSSGLIGVNYPASPIYAQVCRGDVAARGAWDVDGNWVEASRWTAQKDMPSLPRPWPVEPDPSDWLETTGGDARFLYAYRTWYRASAVYGELVQGAIVHAGGRFDGLVAGRPQLTGRSIDRTLWGFSGMEMTPVTALWRYWRRMLSLTATTRIFTRGKDTEIAVFAGVWTFSTTSRKISFTATHSEVPGPWVGGGDVTVPAISYAWPWLPDWSDDLGKRITVEGFDGGFYAEFEHDLVVPGDPLRRSFSGVVRQEVVMDFEHTPDVLAERLLEKAGSDLRGFALNKISTFEADMEGTQWLMIGQEDVHGPEQIAMFQFDQASGVLIDQRMTLGRFGAFASEGHGIQCCFRLSHDENGWSATDLVTEYAVARFYAGGGEVLHPNTGEASNWDVVGTFEGTESWQRWWTSTAQTRLCQTNPCV